MKEIIKFIFSKLSKLKCSQKLLFEIAGNIAERLYDRENGEYDILQDKIYYWILKGFK